MIVSLLIFFAITIIIRLLYIIKHLKYTRQTARDDLETIKQGMLDSQKITEQAKIALAQTTAFVVIFEIN